jgi:hypothetical protein
MNIYAHNFNFILKMIKYERNSNQSITSKTQKALKDTKNI